MTWLLEIFILIKHLLVVVPEFSFFEVMLYASPIFVVTFSLMSFLMLGHWSLFWFESVLCIGI